jgi:pheromone shutdown-related protein TraB
MTSEAATAALIGDTEPWFTIEHEGRRITVLGTAHISRSSADKVAELIDRGAYDAVAIELCPSRHNALMNPDELSQMNLFEVFRQKKASMVAASLALGAYQQRMAEQLDIRPGAEMLAAIDGARARHLPVLLIDREIAVTLRRLYRNVPWWKRLNLVSGLLASLVTSRRITEEEIERLKEGDILESTFSQFAEQSKELYLPLIDERDRYMSARVANEFSRSDYRNMLVIVGAGHLRGIAGYLPEYIESTAPDTSDRTIRELDELPPPSRWPKTVAWLVVMLILTGFAIGFSRSPELGLRMLLDWIVINGGLAALGTAVAGGHAVTIVGAFAAAPLTSLNPMVGAGMVTAAIESWIRKPQVRDFASLRKDTASFSGWRRNRVARTLLVFLFATLGSAAGTYLAGFMIFQRLIQS